MNKYVPTDAKLVPPEATLVFKGVIYDVYHWEQEQFDGTYKTFEMLKHLDVVYAFGIVDDKIVAIHQLQPGWPHERLSIPGGLADPGETPLQAAQRETLEETGYTFDNWRLVEVIQASEHTEAFIYYYVAWGPGEQQPLKEDAGERIRTDILSLESLQQAYSETHDYRLAPLVLERVKSIEELMNLPEYHGQEIEVSGIIEVSP